MMGGPQQHLQADTPPPPPMNEPSPSQTLAGMSSMDSMNEKFNVKADAAMSNSDAAAFLNEREMNRQIEKQAAENPEIPREKIADKVRQDFKDAGGQHPDSTPELTKQRFKRPEGYVPWEHRMDI